MTHNDIPHLLTSHSVSAVSTSWPEFFLVQNCSVLSITRALASFTWSHNVCTLVRLVTGDLLLDDVVPVPEPLGLPDHETGDVALELQHHSEVAAPVH